MFGTFVTEPVRVELPNVISAAAGYTHTVALTDDGTVWAWGSNGAGQLSNGTFSSLPVSVCMPFVVDLTGNQ